MTMTKTSVRRCLYQSRCPRSLSSQVRKSTRSPKSSLDGPYVFCQLFSLLPVYYTENTPLGFNKTVIWPPHLIPSIPKFLIRIIVSHTMFSTKYVITDSRLRAFQPCCRMEREDGGHHLCKTGSHIALGRGRRVLGIADNPNPVPGPPVPQGI